MKIYLREFKNFKYLLQKIFCSVIFSVKTPQKNYWYYAYYKKKTLNRSTPTPHNNITMAE